MTATFAGSGNFSRKPRQKLSGIANSQSHFTVFVKCNAAASGKGRGLLASLFARKVSA
jgi:hypothetical protein